MKQSVLVGVVFGAAVATVGGVFAGYKMLQDEPDAYTGSQYAEAPAPLAEECQPSADEPRDEHRIAGTVVGAVVGGAVGKDIGDRDITTAAGAAAGALAGNQIQKEIQENRASRNGC